MDCVLFCMNRAISTGAGNARSSGPPHLRFDVGWQNNLRLADSDRLAAVRFSIDEWMAALFWKDSPQPLDPAWSMERFGRCLTQICGSVGDASLVKVPSSCRA